MVRYLESLEWMRIRNDQVEVYEYLPDASCKVKSPVEGEIGEHVAIELGVSPSMRSNTES